MDPVVSSPSAPWPSPLDVLDPAWVLTGQRTADGTPTVWVSAQSLPGVLRTLKGDPVHPFPMLFDLTAIDERRRTHREGQPASDFTLVYHLLSTDRGDQVRIKVPLLGERPVAPSIVSLWPGAAWYEREVWDLFGIGFADHPDLRRILMPEGWPGHPLRKEHPARATENPPFRLSDERAAAEQEALRFRQEGGGTEGAPDAPGDDTLTLNLGPQHPGTHGLLRIVLRLDGEEIVAAFPEIGFHHRGAEKMGERQTWHSYIPYADRVDYLGGALNELAYLLPLEQLAGIEVPPRAQRIRVMLAELFRIASHLVWYGTFAQDVGAMSPVFYMFSDRERILDIASGITGGRMHPSWFRLGGVAADLPRGWAERVDEFLAWLPPRLAEYDRLVMKNSIFRGRTRGVGAYSLAEALEWGVTGPGLRACGLPFDWRKVRPYSGYDQLEFEIPTATAGDGYDRARVRIEEMRQSLRIIEQCRRDMPAGAIRADHPLAVPPPREEMLKSIETLIHHYAAVGWGPVVPAGEASFPVETSKGASSYYLVSDGGSMSYRTRIRAPSFPHVQMVPAVCRGGTVADLVSYLGSIDYVLADVDR